MKYFRIFYCIVVGMCLAQISAEDVQESSSSTELPTSYREFGQSDRLENFDEVLEENGNLHKDESNKMGNSQEEITIHKTNNTDLNCKISESIITDVQNDELINPATENDVTPTQLPATTYRGIVNTKGLEDSLNDSFKIFFDPEEPSFKIKTLKAQNSDLNNRCKQLAKEYSESVITSDKENYNLSLKIDELEEKIQRDSLFSSILLRLFSLHPLKTITICTHIFLSSCFLIKNGFNYLKQYCAKRRKKAQTAITTQEITIFGIR